MDNANERLVFSDVDLARRLERAEAHSNAKFVKARAIVDPRSGARWIESAGAYAMFDGVSSPITQTFGLGLFEEATNAALDEIEVFFRERGAPVCHEVSPLAGVAVAARLAERGYHPVEYTSVMYRDLSQGAELGLPSNDDIRIRPIRETEGDLWAQVTVKGWGEAPELAEFLAALGPISVRREDAISFLAEKAGIAIASGVLCFHQGVALFGGACTIPEARGLGAQRALMAARLRYALENDCDIAMMCAAPGSASQRNAERCGFRIAYTRTKWQLSRGPD